MSNHPDARRIAASVVSAVLKQGVFATASLDRALRAQPTLDPRDKALATEIVYGTLRTRGFLVEQLRKLAPRGLPRTEADVESHLLVAAYQLSFLDRVPAFAVVDAAVGAISQIAGKSVGGFANAVLRRLAQQPRVPMDTALLDSAPSWLLAALRQAVGEDGARAALGCITSQDGVRLENAALAPPPCVRLMPGAPIPEWMVDAERGRLCTDAYLLPRHGDLQQRPEWHAGHYVVQEEGAMFAGQALGALEGETVLDCCAGRGQKSSTLALAVGETGQLWSTDIGETKLRELESEFARLHLPAPQTAIVDWTKTPALPANFPKRFDRILVDAPCSGTGTLRHRPEIALRLKPSDVERLAGSAEAILRQVARVASPTTTVLFVVCSVLTRECEGVVERVLDVYEPAPFPAGLPQLANQASYRLLPHIHRTDGFFLASLRPRLPGKVTVAATGDTVNH